MCFKLNIVNRRTFLSFSAVGLAAGGLLAAGGAMFPVLAATTLTPDEALAKLKAGNLKFVNAPQLCASDITNQRASLAKGQAPWATILTCSDSRVSPELIFGGVNLGEFFVARNAGNMADTATMGTIEYGAEHLGSPLIVILGQQKCGAVVAACDVVEKHTKLPGSIGPMVEAIVPAAKAVQGMPGDFVDNAVRESARRTATKIQDSGPQQDRQRTARARESENRLRPLRSCQRRGRFPLLARRQTPPGNRATVTVACLVLSRAQVRTARQFGTGTTRAERPDGRWATRGSVGSRLTCVTNLAR
jgi:carbonic anhydrase